MYELTCSKICPIIEYTKGVFGHLTYLLLCSVLRIINRQSSDQKICFRTLCPNQRALHLVHHVAHACGSETLKAGRDARLLRPALQLGNGNDVLCLGGRQIAVLGSVAHFDDALANRREVRPVG